MCGPDDAPPYDPPGDRCPRDGCDHPRDCHAAKRYASSDARPCNVPGCLCYAFELPRPVAGACAGRGPGLGHRFDVQSSPVSCLDCGALMDDLYIPGTYLPRPAGWTPGAARDGLAAFFEALEAARGRVVTAGRIP